MNKEYITIYKDKNGEWDFGVSGLVSEIKNEEVREFRSIIITAIYIAEDMLRRKCEQEQPLCKEIPQMEGTQEALDNLKILNIKLNKEIARRNKS